jgi:trimethylguanosine synthase
LAVEGGRQDVKASDGSAAVKDQGRSDSICPFGPELQKYWNRRYELFARFDLGIAVDEEGLYSAVPEEAALSVASIVRGTVVLDAFCGVGGSAIGMARAGLSVIALDIDAQRVCMARHNASIYEVGERIEFLTGDFRKVASTVEADSVYLDPRWGGPNYRSFKNFQLKDFEPDGRLLLDLSMNFFQQVLLRAPLNFDVGGEEMKRYGIDVHPDESHGRLISRTLDISNPRKP